MFCFVFPVAFLLVVVIVGGTAKLIGNWVLRPLDQAGRRLQLPMQFTVADFLCLFFMLQLPMAFIHSGPVNEESFLLIVFLDVFVWGSIGTMWWISVRTLSRAGILSPWRRSVFLAIVVPVTIVGAIAVLGLVPTAIVISLDNRIASGLGLFGGALGLVFALYLCGLYTRWMVSRTEGRVTEEGVASETSVGESPEDDRPGSARHGCR